MSNSLSEAVTKLEHNRALWKSLANQWKKKAEERAIEIDELKQQIEELSLRLEERGEQITRVGEENEAERLTWNTIGPGFEDTRSFS